jgi:dsDNA-binding SOS-regulon protein
MDDLTVEKLSKLSKEEQLALLKLSENKEALLTSLKDKTSYSAPLRVQAESSK